MIAPMRRLLPAALFLGLSCAAGVADDAAKVRLLMGRNDRLKLEIQLLTAEKDPDRAIDERIGVMIRAVKEATALRPLKDAARNDLLPGLSVQALADLESLRGLRWSPQTREANWNRLEAACATCHLRVR